MISLVPSSLLWFPPFHFSLIFLRLPEPILPEGKCICLIPISVSLPAPQLFPLQQTRLLLRAPSTSNPFPPSLQVNNRENWKCPRRGRLQPRKIVPARCQVLSHQRSPGLLSSGWMVEPPSPALTPFAVFHATQSIIAPEKFSPFMLPKPESQKLCSEDVVRCECTLHFQVVLFPSCAALYQQSSGHHSLCFGPCNYVFSSCARSKVIMELQPQLGQKSISLTS